MDHISLFTEDDSDSDNEKKTKDKNRSSSGNKGTVCGPTVLIDSDDATIEGEEQEDDDDMDIEVVSEQINVQIVKENLMQKG
jgi:hypothetical protein